MGASRWINLAAKGSPHEGAPTRVNLREWGRKASWNPFCLGFCYSLCNSRTLWGIEDVQVPQLPIFLSWDCFRESRLIVSSVCNAIHPLWHFWSLIFFLFFSFYLWAASPRTLVLPAFISVFCLRSFPVVGPMSSTSTSSMTQLSFDVDAERKKKWTLPFCMIKKTNCGFLQPHFFSTFGSVRPSRGVTRNLSQKAGHRWIYKTTKINYGCSLCMGADS